MAKRKRSPDDDLEKKLSEYQQELFRAIKAAKGLERQRLSKRLQRDKKYPEKIQRLQREVVVLKSLDLRQTAQAHLAASLVKISAIADHPSIPDYIKQGPPKLDLSEEDKISLHNVTSALYNSPGVREVVEKAINGVCLELELPIPEKKKRKKQKGSDAQKDIEDGMPEAQTKREGSAGPSKLDHRDAKKTDKVDDAGDEEEDDDSSFLGFSDAESDRHDKGGPPSGGSEDDNNDSSDREEALLSKYDELVGDSEEEEEEQEDAEELRAKYAALLNEPPSDDPNDAEDESDDSDDLGDIESDLGDSDGDEQASSTGSVSSVSPPSQPPKPAAKKTKGEKQSTSTPATTTTTFLPSLMGGYFSGSESASDVDVAPRKKRLGQRQRQAIAERKFGEKARHIQKMAEREKRKAGRDHGWDMKRGAVDGTNTGRKPWKKGIADPLSAAGQRGKPKQDGEQHKKGPANSNRTTNGKFGKPVGSKKPMEKEEPLHPSWQAKKKMEAQQRSATFQGTKIKF